MTFIATTIAGSDSGGGAGIQADLKTFSALGVYGTSVITALTAQNTKAVTAVLGVPGDVIAAQIAALADDIMPHAVKIGMLGDVPTIETVAAGLQSLDAPVVLDPVMIAKSGDALLAQSAVDALRTILVPKADILTPNLPEAACLLEQSEAETAAEMIAQGEALCALGARAVLMKGGHGKGAVCHDILISPTISPVGRLELTAERRNTRNTHGTGCTISAAIAAGLAKGLSVEGAVSGAHAYVQGAIARADELNIGSGHGPVHHFHALWD